MAAHLGRASRIYPELADGLRTARPSELCLDTDGAYRFLSSVAALLDEAGFGVLLPSGGTGVAGSGLPSRRTPRSTAW